MCQGSVVCICRLLSDVGSSLSPFKIVSRGKVERPSCRFSPHTLFPRRGFNPSCPRFRWSCTRLRVSARVGAVVVDAVVVGAVEVVAVVVGEALQEPKNRETQLFLFRFDGVAPLSEKNDSFSNVDFDFGVGVDVGDRFRSSARI